MKLLFVMYGAVFCLVFLFGTTLAQNQIHPAPLNVMIAKECQPPDAQCFVVPAAALQELDNRFKVLKDLIVEKNKVIKELQEYQSKTCVRSNDEWKH